MKHFNLELERLEQRIVPTVLSVPYISLGGCCDCGTSATEDDSKASSGGSKEGSKGSKSGASGTGSSN